MFSADPRSTPTARLLRALHYDEAQEIATQRRRGAAPALHLPARQYRIPLHVYADRRRPQLEGTRAPGRSGDARARRLKAVCTKKGITLVALESRECGTRSGFLADAFEIFKQHGMSVDLVSTSETNVTVSLDPAGQHARHARVADLVRGPVARCAACRSSGPCASVSLVGRNIRAHPAQLGGAL